MVDLVGLLAFLVWLYAQILKHLRIELASRAQFGQIILETLSCGSNVRVEGREIVGIVTGRTSGGCWLFFAGSFTAFLQQAL
jgi:hypothetical protein